MIYFLAFVGVLLYSLLRFLITQASGFIISGLGLWYLFSGNIPVAGAILLIGGLLIIIAYNLNTKSNLPYNVPKRKKRGGGL